MSDTYSYEEIAVCGTPGGQALSVLPARVDIGLRSVLEGIPWWGYGVVGVCYLVFVGFRLFEGSSLPTPGLAVRVGLGWVLIDVSYLKHYGYV